jgi:hypothetical protein
MRFIGTLDFHKKYYPVKFDEKNKHSRACEWCDYYEGEGGYTIGVRHIYFESELDAVQCALKHI